jgi:ketosteroid isomerase-like protein
MKYRYFLSAFIAVGLSILGLCEAVKAGAPGTADDRVIAEVKAATEAFYEALNRADAATAARYLLPGGDSFPRSGRKLDPEATTAEQSRQNLQALFDGGLRFRVSIRELQVKPYGDTAVATFYTAGATQPAVGHPPSKGVFRASYVWVRRPQGWQIAHFHLSPLVSD